MNQKNQPAYLRLYEELRGKISAFLEDIDLWRRQNRELSLHELLRMLYRETGYYDYLGMTAGGALRQANLRLLCERAQADGARTSLHDFLKVQHFLRYRKAKSKHL